MTRRKKIGGAKDSQAASLGGPMAEWGSARKKAASQQKFPVTAVELVARQASVRIWMLQEFFSRCREAVGRAAGCLGLHGRRAQVVLSSTAISVVAFFLQMRRREKKSPNRSLVEAESDLPCSRVWSVRRVKLRLNTAPPCCHDCNQMAFLIAVCVTL